MHILFINDAVSGKNGSRRVTGYCHDYMGRPTLFIQYSLIRRRRPFLRRFMRSLTEDITPPITRPITNPPKKLPKNVHCPLTTPPIRANSAIARIQEDAQPGAASNTSPPLDLILSISAASSRPHFSANGSNTPNRNPMISIRIKSGVSPELTCFAYPFSTSAKAKQKTGLDIPPSPRLTA